MKRLTALLLALCLMFLPGCSALEEIIDLKEIPILGQLLSGSGEPADETQPRQSGSQPGEEPYLSLEEELAQARQVKLELGPEAQAVLGDFADAVLVLRDQGLEYLSYGMPRQASWYLSFAGGSVSALRYGAELLLGESSGGFSGWDTIGAISLCSPVPLLCEAITAEKAGDAERAAECREQAALNPYTGKGFDDFSALVTLSEDGLKELVEGLKAFEAHIYWFYPADPQGMERSGMEWSADYHMTLAAVYLEMGFEAEAAASCLDALAADPFDPNVFTLCATVMYEISDIELMQTYIEEGLLMDPDHGGLNTMAALLYSGTGDNERAQTHLQKARTAELTENEAAICDAVEAFLKGE